MQRINLWPWNRVVSSQDLVVRFWEVDALRGFAVVLMVFFHFVWDLSYFKVVPIDALSTPWQVFARTIGTLFVFVLGVSMALRAERQAIRAPGGPGRRFWQQSLRRGALLFGLGMLITLATYLGLGNAYVRFGILHLLGVTLIVTTPFVYLPAWMSLVASVPLIGLGWYLNGVAVSFPWLIWLGLPQAGVMMADYYPLLPWAGVALPGIAFGCLAYSGGQRRFPLPDQPVLPPLRGLCWLGRYSLAVYLIHQPVILGILFGLGLASR